MQPPVPMPSKGASAARVLEALDRLEHGDADYRHHRIFGLVYRHSEDHEALIREVAGRFLHTNALNPMAFRSLRRLEAETVSMAADLFHGDHEVVGPLTSGGTESLLLAVLAMREWARAHRPWVLRPEVLVPASAHAAFYKAGHLFGVRIRRVPLGPDFRVDLRALDRRIGWQTIGLVASAPCYPYGVVDPVPELGDIARRKGIPLHVDACLGGFLLPFVETLPAGCRHGEIPPWDFRVPGVTSLSADVHKYGYGAKGASLILYRSGDWMRHQFTVETDWCGGVYVSPTLAGTRPGGPIAAAWAALASLGREGYRRNARQLMEIARVFREGIEGIPGLRLLGRPAIPVLGIGAAPGGPDPYAVADRMDRLGWHVDRLQNPAGIHLILNPGHGEVAGEFLRDLREACRHVLDHPESAAEGSAPLYGMIAGVPLRGLVRRNVQSFLLGMYRPPRGPSVIEGSSGDLSETSPGSPGTEEPALPPLVGKAVAAFLRLRKALDRGSPAGQ